jgi:exodeoxyribonuclease V alpha subunit
MRRLVDSLQVVDQVEPYVTAGIVDRGAVLAVNTVLATAGLKAQDSPLATVALALVLMSPVSGNTCVDLEVISQWTFDDDEVGFAWPNSLKEWVNEIEIFRMIIASRENHRESPVRPFVLDGTLLYSGQSFAEEGFVAEKLAELFSQNRLEVITGGPGSGKTTAIAERLIQRLVDASGSNERIVLAAPTGLAAKRMKKALADAVGRKNPGTEVSTRIEALKKQTIHKLLAYNPSLRQQYLRHAGRQLDYDLIIVDEVSMMPLSMMARLLSAMGDETSLILVGDKDQLASVESGSVLADIVEASQSGPSFVEAMTGKYRFAEGSPVAELSDCVNAGDADAAKDVLRKKFPVGLDDQGRDLPWFRWVDPGVEADGLEEVAQKVLKHALEICSLAKNAKSKAQFEELLRFRESQQVVCAHKRGVLGVSGWNASIQKAMGTKAKGRWYIGRPIMVTSNDPVNKLSNGDIGVIWADESNARFGIFEGDDGIVSIPVSKLGDVETVHALTIHKSQGSEYGHTIVVLPSKPSRILTRELVYTAITRAKPDLTLISSEEVFEEAIKTKVQRATGLAPRLLARLTN